MSRGPVKTGPLLFVTGFVHTKSCRIKLTNNKLP
jgi:hypothetical protein